MIKKIIHSSPKIRFEWLNGVRNLGVAVNKTKKQKYEGNKKKFSFSNNVNHKKDRSCSVEEQYRKKKGGHWADCGNKLMEEEPKGTRNKVKKKVEKMLMTQTFGKKVFKKRNKRLDNVKPGS